MKNINIVGVKFDDTVSEENNGYSSRGPSKIALKNIPLNILQQRKKNVQIIQKNF